MNSQNMYNFEILKIRHFQLQPKNIAPPCRKARNISVQHT